MGNSEGPARESAGGSPLNVRAYRFADCRLLAARQCLERAGVELPLTTKLYHLLFTFLTRPGEVLDKETIVEAVWPRQVVTDAALAKQMQRLRQAIGDGDRKSPLLETHRGRGYRLTCPVAVEYADDAQPPRSFLRRGSAARVPLTVATVLALGLGLAAVVTSRQPAPAAPGPALALLPVAASASALSAGTAEYLAARLGTGAAIAPALELAAVPAPARATELGSLRLAERRGGPVAGLQLQRQGDGYRLWINLRSTERADSVELADGSVAALLDRGANWLRERTGAPPAGAASTVDAFALTSYFEGLAASGDGSRCERSADYFRAALASDPGFQRARLRLARCERLRGQPHAAAAGANALLAPGAPPSDSTITLEARLLAARAHLDLGDQASAREHLAAAQGLAEDAVLPLQRLSALAALALLAELDGDSGRARALREERLSLAEREYPLPGYLAAIHLDLAAGALATADHDTLHHHASAARSLAEEHGDLETLVRSYRYLATSYYRDSDLDAAVQLALGARPLLDRVSGAEAKGFFMQFAALSLNLRGHFAEARAYTAALRELAGSSANPMYGAIADLTVMHRLYVQGRFAEAHALAASTRARLENEGGLHAAVPLALSFEAIAAARGAEPAAAAAVLARLEDRYGDREDIQVSSLRARGHQLARSGRAAEGIALLRQAEARYRDTGMGIVADYVGYEIVEWRLATEQAPPWDDIERLAAGRAFAFQLARLRARAHALEGNRLAATAALEEARLRGNDLWSDEDQLQLERYRSGMAMADAREPDDRQGLDQSQRSIW